MAPILEGGMTEALDPLISEPPLILEEEGNQLFYEGRVCGNRFGPYCTGTPSY